MANESANAAAFVRAVLAQCTGIGAVRFFAIVDKASTDDTLQVLHDLARAEPRLEVVWAPENRGAVDAYIRGYREALAARSDWILEIDAGFSHQPEDIPQYWERMEQGCDCVFGSRFMRGARISDSSLKRYLVSRIGTALTNALLGTKLTDMTSGFELFSRETLEMVLRRGIRSRAHFFQTEIKVYCRKLRITEVPIHYRSPSPRLGSHAIVDAFQHLWRLCRLRMTGAL